MLFNAEAQAITFAIVVTKLYVPGVTLSSQDYVKLKQLEFGFKRKMNGNKY